ncbi:MAG: hypothetical protein KDD70_02075 [Bdellovibrionales bacterium]|nr:hypothetical protein [Bdellovibrionales bacterium]
MPEQPREPNRKVSSGPEYSDLPEAPFPLDEQEQSLWEVLRYADKPIRSSLLRLNRILSEKFAGTGVSTNSSCSGHVQESGKIAFLPVVPELFPDGDFPKRPTDPHLTLSSVGSTTTPEQRADIDEFMISLFQHAINRASRDGYSIKLEVVAKPELQDVYGGQSVTPIPTYVFNYRIATEEQHAASALISFWGAFEKALTEQDCLNLTTELELADFLIGPPPFSEQIRPT